MRFSMETTTVETLNMAIGVVATKDTITTLTIGEKEFGDKLLMAVSCTAVGEQMMLNLTCKKPKDFDGTPVTIGVKSQKFAAITASLLKFKEDIYIDIDGTSVKLGAGKAEVSIETVAEIPQKIEGGAEMLQMAIKGEELLNLIRRGFSTTSEVVAENGTSNAVLTVDTTTGKVEGFSTTGSMASIANGEVLLPKAPEGNEQVKAILDKMDAELTAYCEKSGQKKEALNIVLPSMCVNHMKTLVAGQAQVQLGVTAQYINVMLGNAGCYTFRQGAKAPATAAAIRAFVDNEREGATRVVFDATQIIQSMSFINDMDKLDGVNGRKAVKLVNSKGKFMLMSAGGEKAETLVPTLAIDGDAVSMGVNGVLFRSLLDVVDRGNVMVTFGNNMAIVENGTIADGASNKVLTFLMKVTDAEDESSDEDASEEPAE